MAYVKKTNNDKMGRPTKYKEEYCDQARKICLLGYTNEDLAKFFEVDVSTIDEWISVYPDFSGSIKEGREDADVDVAMSLRRRALGAVVPETKVFCYEGDTVTEEVKKHYPPDTTAAIFWLKNRQPKYWREKIETEHSGEVKANWAF